MDFPPAQLSVALLPVPLEDEIIHFTQNDVGIYKGAERLNDYDNGTAYITSHRIIWIDAIDPKSKSWVIELARVELFTSTAGYLKRSAKLELKIRPEIPINDSPKVEQTDLSRTKNVSNNVCAVCTFINHPDLLECEMCGSSLAEDVKVVHPAETSATSPAPGSSSASYLSYVTSAIGLGATKEIGDNVYKLSFRRGGCDTFTKSLKMALDAKLWKVKKKNQGGPSAPSGTSTPTISSGLGGIATIMQSVQQSKQAMDVNLTEAFRDLDALMTKASEMVKLAESISAKLAGAGSGASGASSSEMRAFQGYLVELGISNPVTKQSAGDLFSQELARQLSEFLDKALSRTGGMMGLTDLYCLFNRARGVELISPEDLHRSCSMFDQLGLPFRLREFESGLLVVHSIRFSDEASAQKVRDFVVKNAKVTAFEFARAEDIPVVLASEYLLIAEKRGLVCRDESLEGLVFYDNLICQVSLNEAGQGDKVPLNTY
ncbi:EAP30/Vps36 family-domain-containing protein [Cladochytrium replicatum]|nr:EAP30/Vps36 family-domain-containing protein [Cladochytrium replicatum]